MRKVSCDNQFTTTGRGGRQLCMIAVDVVVIYYVIIDGENGRSTIQVVIGVGRGGAAWLDPLRVGILFVLMNSIQQPAISKTKSAKTIIQ